MSELVAAGRSNEMMKPSVLYDMVALPLLQSWPTMNETSTGTYTSTMLTGRWMLLDACRGIPFNYWTPQMP